MYIGIDLGTSGVKAVLMTSEQTVLAEGSAALTVSRPRDGWSEQDPKDWVAATILALDQLAAQQDLSSVRGIGLSGQMHGATVLDADDQVLRPCILWNDTRASSEARDLDQDPQFRDISGNIVFPGFTAPKIAWMRTHEPEVFDRIAKVLLPKDYLRLWLTGEHVSEMSDAAGTSWLATGARDWSDPLLAACGLDRSNMPRLVEGSDSSGQVRNEIALRWGMKAGKVCVAGGAGDNAATAIGTGVSRPGEAFVSLGTSGVLFAASDRYRPAPENAVHTFCHAVPETWHQMGVVLAAADALNWYSRLVGRSAADLTAELDKLETPGKTIFLPYLGGERTPLNSAVIRAGFIGLEHATDTNAATRAVLEGVGFALRDCHEMLKATGTDITSLIAVGGGSQSAYWLKTLATILNQPIQCPISGDFGAALGAARLGMMAAEGVGGEIAQAPGIQTIIDPDTDLVPAFEAAYRRFKSAQSAIGDLT